MPEFVITPEGWLREEAIHDAALRAARLFPGIDIETFEASTLLIRVFKAVRDGGETYLESFGLTASRIPVLETIHRSDEKRLTIGDIANALKVTPTNVSKLIDALERDGWVRKVPNPDDGRSTYAELTAFAVERLEQLVPRLSERRACIWSVLSKEEKQILAHLLAKLHMHILSRPATRADVGLDWDEALLSKV